MRYCGLGGFCGADPLAGRPAGGRPAGGRSAGARTAAGRRAGGRIAASRSAATRPIGSQPIGARPVGTRLRCALGPLALVGAASPLLPGAVPPGPVPPGALLPGAPPPGPLPPGSLAAGSLPAVSGAGVVVAVPLCVMPLPLIAGAPASPALPGACAAAPEGDAPEEPGSGLIPVVSSRRSGGSARSLAAAAALAGTGGAGSGAFAGRTTGAGFLGLPYSGAALIWSSVRSSVIGCFGFAGAKCSTLQCTAILRAPTPMKPPTSITPASGCAGGVHQHVHQPADRLAVGRRHGAAEDRHRLLGRNALDLARRRVGGARGPFPDQQARDCQAKPKNLHESDYP